MTQTLDFGNIRIVLVNTSHPGNIGATARAMKNMGLQHLHLVAPRDFPSGVAVGRAKAALDILDNAQISDTLQKAVADCALVIGASARSRRIPWPVLSPTQCAQKVVAENKGNKVALVFGREDTGLSNEELQLCHFHVQIPADEQYSSLNLAAAVLLICYEVRLAMMQQEQGYQRAADAEPETEYWDVIKANSEQMEYFYAHLEQVMIDLNFHDPDNPRLLMLRMRRLFSRIRPDRMEISILRGLLTHMQFALDKRNNQDEKSLDSE
ncbi:MAG: RNA methyltransferase [Pseudomonadales bacterium]|nr:RNA methyltransferase [Pseudomonadales bacterium]